MGSDFYPQSPPQEKELSNDILHLNPKKRVLIFTLHLNSNKTNPGQNVRKQTIFNLCIVYKQNYSKAILYSLRDYISFENSLVSG